MSEKENTNENRLTKRLGNVLESVIVLAIVGLTAVVFELRVSIAQLEIKQANIIESLATSLHSLDEKMDYEKKYILAALESVEKSSSLQIGLINSIVERVTTGGFDNSRGTVLETAVDDIRHMQTKQVDSHGRVLEWKSGVDVKIITLEGAIADIKRKLENN